VGKAKKTRKAGAGQERRQAGLQVAKISVTGVQFTLSHDFAALRNFLALL